MDKIAFELAQVYQLLEPGPVLLLATAGPQRPNVMTLSWQTMVEFEPPLVACVLSPSDYSFETLQRDGECTLNIPDAGLVDAVVGCGNHSGRDLDKFAAFGLTPRPAAAVAAPLIDECDASLECRVVERDLVDRHGLFIVEVVRAWRRPGQPQRTLHHCGQGTFRIAGETLHLPSAMR